MQTIGTIEQLEQIYGEPGATALVKETDRIIPEYADLIAASPFMALATSGPEGLDCSPRGERGGVVRMVDDRTLLLPDRRGNNRIDSLRNIVRDGRVALLFLIPGSGTTLRLNGQARLLVDEALRQSFAVDGSAPRCVIEIKVASVYFQCARAIQRSSLWRPEEWPDISALPTPGRILSATSSRGIDGEAYDAEWPARAARSMW